MKHPTELLSQYLLGELEIAEQEYLEKHLETCPTCLAEYKKLSEAWVAMVDNLPEAELSEQSFDRIQANLKSASAAKIIKDRPRIIKRQAAWQSWAIAASLIIGVAGFLNAFQERQNYRQIAQEQAQIAQWLADSKLRVSQIKQADQSIASILLHDDGKALFVINQPAPKEQTYQLWGHKDGQPTSLGLIAKGIYEIDYTNYDAIGISLEPKGGSLRPTRALGKIPVS